jgi:hypothetical protein
VARLGGNHEKSEEAVLAQSTEKNRPSGEEENHEEYLQGSEAKTQGKAYRGGHALVWQNFRWGH